MDEEKTNKNLAKFACEKCDFITNNKFNYKTHLLTAKHKKTNFGLANPANPAIQEKECSGKFACKCGKKYLHSSSLTKHKKKCSGLPLELDLILKLIKDNKEFQNLIIEQNKQQAEYQSQKDDKILECLKEGKTINTNCNNNNNNKFNINIFLNEQCKDALNIMEFVDQMQLKLSDFESYGEKGYVESVSQIMVRELKGLDVTKRPIHCSDLKREVMYIKDNDAWEKDNEEKEKIMGCLIGSFKGVMGTYSFSSNGVFSYEQHGVYAGYWEGRWKFSGSNKIKINKSWLNENCCYTITVSKYCEVFNLDGLN